MTRKSRGTHRKKPHRKRGYRSSGNTGGLWLPERLPLFPEAGAELASVFLNKPTSHPNIFRKRIVRLEGQPKVGDWVQVFCNPQSPADYQPGPEAPAECVRVGYGWFNPKSEIAVRMVQWSTEPPDAVFWGELVERAVELREKTLDLARFGDCYRVVHAEADGIPGLVVDRYANCLSAEVFAAAAAPRAAEILSLLQKRLGTEHWLIQPGPHLMSQDGFQFPASQGEQLPSQIIVEEHGVRFAVRFADSHKTGFFCDQRENRLRLRDFVAGKSVLDLCCYTGGFAVNAAAAGASEVTGVDLDENPLELAKRNAGLNQLRVRFTQADAFAYMRDMLRQGRTFDVVVLDPPKLIRNRGELEEGTRKHFDLNRLAMQLVSPGGILLTCSCAGLLSNSDFSRLVISATRSAFRPSDWNPNPQPRSPQILATVGAASCHPVATRCPETEYLKAVWMRL
jgi:23S rRNA (cytosine1962-C5)-methyltransferase